MHGYIRTYIHTYIHTYINMMYKFTIKLSKNKLGTNKFHSFENNVRQKYFNTRSALILYHVEFMIKYMIFYDISQAWNQSST